MLVNFFDKTYPMLSMVIKSDYADMLQWAVWLGFETVGCSQYKNINFIHFVRCNPDINNVVDELSRPIKHWEARKDTFVEDVEWTLKMQI